MLMPILTVKAATAPAAHAAAVVEMVTPKDKAQALPPVRIAGRQSEVMLKILETLNRHLVGSEPLPREALVRLLDTLAKILKFPPLPQESLRDFSKRLAVFLETLPPTVRQAVEKQLGQRNLAVSIRILTEALKMPSILDAPRLPERAYTPLTPGRPLLTQPETRPATALAAQQQPTQQQINQSRPTGQQQSQPATQPLPTAQALPHAASNPTLAAGAFVPDPGILQAALKKAFGDDEETVGAPVITAGEYENEHDAIPAVSRKDDGAKPHTPHSGDATAAGASARMPAKANDETIPLLRAAAAFLASDPDVLSQVSAIAGGDIDSRIMSDLQVELDLDLSELMDLMEQAAQPEQAELRQDWELPEQAPLTVLPEPEPQAEPTGQWLDLSPPEQAAQPGLPEPGQEGAPLSQAEQPRQSLEEPAEKPAVPTQGEGRHERPAEPLRERQAAALPFETASRQELPSPHIESHPVAERVTAKAETLPQNATPLFQPAPVRRSEEVAGFQGHDLGEWELEIESPAQLVATAENSSPAPFEPEEDLDGKIFSQALKALVEASLPLPEETADGNASEALFSALAGETADMDAETLFAGLEAADDAAVLPDTTLLTGDIAEATTFETDTLSGLFDATEEGNLARSSLNQSPAMDEPARDAPVARQPETSIARDAIPYAMIPYLPAKTEGIRAGKEEDEEQPSFAGHDEHGDNREAPEDQENGSEAASAVDDEEAADETGDAYDLYRRMGGLG